MAAEIGSHFDIHDAKTNLPRIDADVALWWLASHSSFYRL
jgi:hypothetical protein